MENTQWWFIRTKISCTQNLKMLCWTRNTDLTSEYNVELTYLPKSWNDHMVTMLALPRSHCLKHRPKWTCFATNPLYKSTSGNNKNKTLKKHIFKIVKPSTMHTNTFHVLFPIVLPCNATKIPPRPWGFRVSLYFPIGCLLAPYRLGVC